MRFKISLHIVLCYIYIEDLDISIIINYAVIAGFLKEMQLRISKQNCYKTYDLDDYIVSYIFDNSNLRKESLNSRRNNNVIKHSFP